MNSQGLEWRRLFSEGAVILISILLAFSIDAWWEEQQDSEEANHQIDRVLTELKTGKAILEVHILDLQSSFQTCKKKSAGRWKLTSRSSGDPLPWINRFRAFS